MRITDNTVRSELVLWLQRDAALGVLRWSIRACIRARRCGIGHLRPPLTPAQRPADVAGATVRNIDDALVKRLRVRAAEHGRSAEAEHREILRTTLLGSERDGMRADAAARLAEFRRRTAGRGAPASVDLLDETRRDRAEQLGGTGLAGTGA